MILTDREKDIFNPVVVEFNDFKTLNGLLRDYIIEIVEWGLYSDPDGVIYCYMIKDYYGKKWYYFECNCNLNYIVDRINCLSYYVLMVHNKSEIIANYLD